MMIPQSYECFDCRRVSIFTGDARDKCEICGGSRIQLLSKERVKEGMESGAYYNIDLRTGGHAKKKRRR